MRRAEQLFGDSKARAGVFAIAEFLSDGPRTITALKEHGLSLDEPTRLVDALAERLMAFAENLHSIRDEYFFLMGNSLYLKHKGIFV